jgi:hypothetical protein
MALSSGPACPPFTYGHLPVNSGHPAMIPHSTTGSSIKTQNTISLNGIISTNTSSTQGSQAQLAQPRWRQPHRRKAGLKDKFRRRCNSFQSPNNTRSTPRTSTTVVYMGIFATFLVFLSLAAHFAFKPVWIAVMMVGGSVSFGLLLACFLEHRRGDFLSWPFFCWTRRLIQ